MILLKEGTILAEGEAIGNNALALDAVPQQNLYRGEYYDVTLKINEETEITIKSKTKASLGQSLKISFAGDDIIVYAQKPQAGKN